MTSLNRLDIKDYQVCIGYVLPSELQWLTLHLPKNFKKLERSHPKWGMVEAATLQLSRASCAIGCWASRTSPTAVIELATTAWNYWRRTWNGGEWSHSVHNLQALAILNTTLIMYKCSLELCQKCEWGNHINWSSDRRMCKGCIIVNSSCHSPTHHTCIIQLQYIISL